MRARKPPKYTDWKDAPDVDSVLYTMDLQAEGKSHTPPPYHGRPPTWGPREDFISFAMALRYAYAGKSATAALCAYAIRDRATRERLVADLERRGLL